MLAEHDLQVIVFKGAALLNRVYRNIALRPMEDIDLIVRRRDLGGIKNVLEKLGFIQRRLYPGSFRKGMISIDLHSDFLSSDRIRSRREALDLKLKDPWKKAVPIDASKALYQLSLNDHLVALSFHLLKHRYDRLVWLVDIAEIIEAFFCAAHWQDLIAHCQRHHAEKLVLYAMFMTKHLLGGDIPEYALAGLGKQNLSLIEERLLQLRLMHLPLGTMMDLLWMFQIRGAGKKLQFISESLFPRREIMNQIFPNSSYQSGTRLKRILLVSLQVLSDLLNSLREMRKGGHPLM